jgi:RNA polymerase sigma factor (sigma-70 family)
LRAAVVCDDDLRRGRSVEVAQRSVTALVQETDARIVARCRAGDGAAWDALVERYSRYVFAIATRGFGLSEHDAEDVFQEVFARVFTHLDTLRDGEALRPWLGQLVRRLAIDRLRAGGREQPGGELPDTGQPDFELERIELALDVHRAMAVLPEHCQAILDRFFARDESYVTIAGATGLPSGTIASRISRCLAKLRMQMQGAEAGEPRGRSPAPSPS